MLETKPTCGGSDFNALAACDEEPALYIRGVHDCVVVTVSSQESVLSNHDSIFVCVMRRGWPLLCRLI